MIVWTGIMGGLLGWGLAEFEGFGFLLGGLCGLIAGWGLRQGARAEIERAVQPLQAQIEMLLARGVATPAAPTPPVRETEQEQYQPVASREVPPQPSLWRAPTPAAVIGNVYDSGSQPPAPPPEPSAIETAVISGIGAAKAWLFGGNTIVRIGLILLLVGLSFLASYAAAAGLFPIEARLAVVAAFGIALLAVGFRTRATRPGFELALQGGGIAVLYLTLFAAARLYGLFPVMAAFVLMVAVCALGCALALLQRSQALAGTAFAGGFAVPQRWSRLFEQRRGPDKWIAAY